MTSTESHARDEICRIGQSLFQRGYVHGTAGNISVRLAGGFLITPTDACLGTLDPARLALLDEAGNQLSGDKASKTILLHRRIYETVARNGGTAGAIIHTHSTSLVACSLKQLEADRPVVEGDELLPALTPYFVMKVGRVPHLPYRRPGSSDAAALVEAAIEKYAKKGLRLRAVMSARLGPNVWHETPAAAMAVLEELEETARLWLQAKPPVLSEVEIEDLRQAFGAQW